MVVTYNMSIREYRNSEKQRILHLRQPQFLSDFFPKIDSPLLSLDFAEISKSYLIWVLGYENGQLIIIRVSGVEIGTYSKLQVIEFKYDPLAPKQSNKRKEGVKEQKGSKHSLKDIHTGKIKLSTSLGSPIYAVNLIYSTDQLSPSTPIDLVVTSFDKKMVLFRNIFQEGLVEQKASFDLSQISCINCLFWVRRNE